MNKRFATFVLVATMFACSKQEPPAPADTAAPSATAPAASAEPAASSATTPAPSASAATAEPPTEEDFEHEATDQVTAKTLDAQLDALEKEIKAD